jgi:hypothetical protein
MNIERLIAALREVVPADKPVVLHEPEFRGNEKKYLGECIDSTFVT